MSASASTSKDFLTEVRTAAGNVGDVKEGAKEDFITRRRQF